MIASNPISYQHFNEFTVSLRMNHFHSDLDSVERLCVIGNLLCKAENQVLENYAIGNEEESQDVNKEPLQFRGKFVQLQKILGHIDIFSYPVTHFRLIIQILQWFGSIIHGKQEERVSFIAAHECLVDKKKRRKKRKKD